MAVKRLEHRLIREKDERECVLVGSALQQVERPMSLTGLVTLPLGWPSGARPIA
jgi:hypothetical protein